jgi:ferredoxin
MPLVRILPHPDLCPEGKDFEVKRGAMLCESMLKAGVAIEHACDMVAACATCHVHVPSRTTKRTTSSTTPGAWTRSRGWPAA